MDLTDDGSKIVAPGSQVAFPHTLVNNGNGADTFTLASQDLGGDFSFVSGTVKIFADANGDGIPDNNVSITTTPSIAAGQAFQMVIVGIVPGTAAGDQEAQLRITATSVGDGAQTDFNTDTVTVTANAAINITKSINVSSGPAGSGPYTYTLTYQNSGNNTATNLVITDVIPTGMTYEADSGRASVTGGATLTDGDDGFQGTSPNRIDYSFDSGTLSVIVENLAPGQSGTLTFQVNVNSGVPPSILVNRANYAYWDGAANTSTFQSNPANFTVLQTAAVSLGDHTIANAPQGSTITFTNALVNNGNGTDSFDLTVDSSTFPLGSTITFYNSGGAPMTDSGGSSAPDTGPIAPGGSYNVLVVVTLPPSATGGSYQLIKRATSTFNPAVSDPGTDILTVITPNTVDLVNDAGGTLGAGAGPEGAPVTTISRDPGTTARFSLYVRNQSTVADTFDLSITNTLPAGWTVVFRNSSLAVIANTGIIAPSGNMLVYADVSVPTGQAPGTFSVYFQVKSPVTGTGDVKRDAVTVNVVRAIQITPNNSGQVFPGGSVVYNHTLQNLGNVAENGVTLDVLNSQSTAGFTSVLYRDANNNGSLDASDTLVSTVSLAAGISTNLFVKVFAPNGATPGSIDVATVTARSADTTLETSATDTSTVISGDLTIVKDQALDANNNGVLDGAEAYTTGNITTGALPGASIIYRLRVTNTGTADATDVVVTDTTPSYTTYSNYANAAPAASTQSSSILTPANGAPGTITVAIGTMTPGQTVTITFGVTINQ